MTDKETSALIEALKANNEELLLISHKLLLKVLYYLIYQPFRGFR
ncbi:hypothetical protein [Lactobacillus delbrueckii]|nr:hypothetical protein [Lactobacillus delbrueckii]